MLCNTFLSYSILYIQEAEKTEDDLELEKRREACREALREYLKSDNGGVKASDLNTVLFNIRVTFVQHPMDLIGRRMAASAREMAIQVARGGSGTCCAPVAAFLAPLLNRIRSFCTVRRLRKFKLGKMIIMGPLLTLGLYTWDLGKQIIYL